MQTSAKSKKRLDFKLGEKNLVMLCYSKILGSRKILLIVLTLALSFVIPFLYSLTTGKLFHNDFIIQGFLEDWPAFLGIGIFGVPFLSLIFIVYCEKISITLSDIIQEKTIEIDDDRYANLVTQYQNLYNSDLANLLLILAIIVNLFWIIPNTSDNKLSWYTTFLGSGSEALSIAGFYFAALVTICSYVLLYIGIYGIITIVFLRNLAKAGTLVVNPLHPDKAGGLSKIGSLGLINSYPIIIVGLGITTVFYSDTYYLHFPLFSFLHVSMIFGYLILAPCLFFIPLWVFHRPMQKEKDKMLSRLSKMFKENYRHLSGSKSIGKDPVETLSVLGKINLPTI